jgi:integrase-like protein
MSDPGNANVRTHGAYSETGLRGRKTALKRRFLKARGLRESGLDPLGLDLVESWATVTAKVETLDAWFARSHRLAGRGPKMASVQARHSRSCASGKPWTPIASLDDCDCGPTFYVIVRDGKKLHRERVGKIRRTAERKLTAIQAAEDKGSYQAVPNVRFEKWGVDWLDGLERPTESTVNSYRPTIAYATEAFGRRAVRKLSPSDIAAFLTLMRERKISDSTRAKHLRVLGACLEAAVIDGKAFRNPVRQLRPEAKPRPERKESAYFENEELPRLFAELADNGYRVLLELALKTGMREGELVALTWGDVDLTENQIHVRCLAALRIRAEPRIGLIIRWSVVRIHPSPFRHRSSAAAWRH